MGAARACGQRRSPPCRAAHASPALATHVVAARHQVVHQVRAEEAAPAGDWRGAGRGPVVAGSAPLAAPRPARAKRSAAAAPSTRLQLVIGFALMSVPDPAPSCWLRFVYCRPGCDGGSAICVHVSGQAAVVATDSGVQGRSERNHSSSVRNRKEIVPFVNTRRTVTSVQRSRGTDTAASLQREMVRERRRVVAVSRCRCPGRATLSRRELARPRTRA